MLFSLYQFLDPLLDWTARGRWGPRLRPNMAGSPPKDCAPRVLEDERIHALREDLGVTSLLCWTNFGGLPSDLARASIRRFAEKVMPKFR